MKRRRVQLRSIGREIRATQKQLRIAKIGLTRIQQAAIDLKIARLDRVFKAVRFGCGKLDPWNAMTSIYQLERRKK